MYWGVGGNEAKMEEGYTCKLKRVSKTKHCWGGGLIRQNFRGRIPEKGFKEKKNQGRGEYNVDKLLV